MRVSWVSPLLLVLVPHLMLVLVLHPLLQLLLPRLLLLQCSQRGAQILWLPGPRRLC